MRLNCYILMDELSDQYEMKYYGPKPNDLHLKRPEIYNYINKDSHFEKNRTYCVNTPLLPEIPIFQEGALLICISLKEPPSVYHHQKNGVIWICAPDNDIIFIFNQVQRIFDKYEDWEHQLKNILYTNANIQEMVDASDTILENPIVVIDGAMRFLGYSHIIDEDDRLSYYRSGPDGKIQQIHIPRYLEFREGRQNTEFNLLDELRNIEHYSKDICYRNEIIGNITVPFILKTKRYSTPWVLKIFEDYVSKALIHYERNPAMQSNLRRTAYQDLLLGRLLSVEAQKLLLNEQKRYVVARIMFSSPLSKRTPLLHLCSYIENKLLHSICLEYSDSIAAIAEIPNGEENLYQILPELAESLNLYIGISLPFSNPVQLRYYYEQAHFAMRTAYTAHHVTRIFYFQNCMLEFLLNNCSGGLPLESLYTTGIEKLLAHDAESKTSYVETLRCYLDNAMNITKTAMDLNVHRTSFLERLRHIERLLDDDLDNPDYRLYLAVMLRKIQ